MDHKILLDKINESVKELRTRHTESIKKLTLLQSEIGMIANKISDYEETAKALNILSNFLQKEKV